MAYRPEPRARQPRCGGRWAERLYAGDRRGLQRGLPGRRESAVARVDKAKKEFLVKALLELIENDATIDTEEHFFIRSVKADITIYSLCIFIYYLKKKKIFD